MANRNPNHPEKGSLIKVEPIRKMKDIKAIKKLLHDKPRDLCLFILGINTNLRVAAACLQSSETNDSSAHHG